MVLQRTLLSDGSLDLRVKSLGSSSVKATPKLSSLFNRKPGHVHLCMTAGLCMMTEGIAWHLQHLELCDGETFHKEYVGTAGKKLLKQTLQMEPPHLEDWAIRGGGGPDNADDLREYSPEKEPLAAENPSGKGRGGIFSTAEQTHPKSADRKKEALRDRLERIKEKELNQGEN